MEKREGYKKTDLGWVPETWNVAKIGSFTKPISEKNTKDKISNVVSVTKYDGIVDSLSYFKKQVYSKDLTTYKIIRRGQFAYATIHLDEGSIGRLTSHDKAILSPMYTVFESDDKLVDKEYLFGLLKSNKLMNIYKHIGAGSINRRKSISYESFGNIKIPLPPLQEQQKIAEILTTVDDKISSIEERIQQTEQLKKGLMEKLLTEGIGHTEFKDTEIGRVPTSWDVVVLNQVVERNYNITYGVVQPGEDNEDGILFIRGGDIKNGKISGNLRKISNDISEKYKRTILSGGEILVALVGYPGETAIVPEYLKGANIARQVALLKIRPGISKQYLHQYFSSAFGKGQLLCDIVGSAQQVINLASLKKVKVILPPQSEQKQIASILTAVDDKLDVLQSKKSAFETLKKGLMDQLLTGAMRVKV